MTNSRKLDFGGFFELSDPMATEPFRLRSRLSGDGKAGGINLDMLSHGKSQIQEPVQFDAAQGLKATDFLWTQLVTPVCVSEKVVRILKESGISGWSVYPVEVFDHEGKSHANYHGLAIAGAACEADYNRSTVIAKPPPTPRGRSYDVYRGLFFDEDKWDGSDMFWVGGVRVVVKKVKEVFEQSGIKNVCFTPLIEREVRVRHVRRD